MRCNPDDYREYFASFELSKEREDELILTLWEIVRVFVELGWGVNSINSVFPEIKEKTAKNLNEPVE